MRTASHPYNNRHRQAPSTHTDKQAVRTIGGEQCLILLVYISSATHPNKIGGFVVRGLFSSFMSCASHRKHTSKLNIFSQTIKVSDCYYFLDSKTTPSKCQNASGAINYRLFTINNFTSWPNEESVPKYNSASPPA